MSLPAGDRSQTPLRIFTYFARIQDRFKLPVISLVVLGDEDAKWKPQRYEQKLGGTHLVFDFSVVKLLEYKGQKAELATSKNPFAHVVLAHLAALETKRNNPRRRREKFVVVRQLYDAGFGEQEVIDLFRFIDWVMTLPPSLEEDFQQQLREFEGARALAYISSIERSGIERGLEQGLEQGRREMVLEQLNDKFGGLPESIAAPVEKLDVEQLRSLGKALLGFSSIDDLAQWLDR
jgi:Domain of unknown function (DUF4351)